MSDYGDVNFLGSVQCSSTVTPARINVVTTAQRLAMPPPTGGEMVFDTDERAVMRGLPGGTWEMVAGGFGYLAAADLAGGTDINQAAPTPIPWDIDFFDANVFARPNPDEIQFLFDGPHWVAYNVGYRTSTNARRNVQCECAIGAVSPGTPVARSQSLGYARQLANPLASAGMSFMHFPTVGEILRITGVQVGSAGTAPTEPGFSSIHIFRFGTF